MLTNTNRLNAYVTEDNEGLQVQIEPLIGPMVEDIKNCANACDAYYWKSSVSKFILRRTWADALVQYAQVFVKHREELKLIMLKSQIHLLKSIQ